jgi:hypothetical protein
MPPAEDVQTYLLGAWRMMNGKADGLRMLDISADGFWQSFFAIAVALPALFAGWVSIASGMAAANPAGGGSMMLIVKLALVDIVAWLLPLVGLALVAPLAGIRDRYAHYVIASNWATAIIAWLMLPPVLITLFAPGARELASLLSLGLFLLTLVFMWRLTNAAIAKGPAMATGVFTGMVIASLFVLFGMQDLLGMAPPA